jgi:hypothetical protein
LINQDLELSGKMKQKFGNVVNICISLFDKIVKH